MARKKNEKQKEKKSTSSTSTAGHGGSSGGNNIKSLSEQLSKIGLKIRDVVGDGNCLFRALADQLDGDDSAHKRHRQDVVSYIKEHRSDFEPFIEDDVPFDQHVGNLAEDGTYAGNDAIVAFARLHKLTVIIHQFNSPAWEIHGEVVNECSTSSGPLTSVQLHILYHDHEHYSSVRRINDNSDSPANIKLRGSADSARPQRADSHMNSDGPPANDYARDFVSKVIESTGCRNTDLVQSLCEDAGYYDFDSVCSQVIGLMEQLPSLNNSSSSSHSSSDTEATTTTTTSTCTSTLSGAKPKSSSRQARQSVTKRQRKQEKKERAAQRHRQQNCVGATSENVTGKTDKLTSVSSDDDELITHNIQVLQI